MNTKKSVLVVLAFTMTTIAITQPTISFTFDDGSTSDWGQYDSEEWNQMILTSLSRAGVTAAFFVKTGDKNSQNGKKLLDSWDREGHLIANHTVTHPNFNWENVYAQEFENELLKADALIKGYDNYVRLFRFPYLKEGNTPEKVDSIRQILQSHDYRHGHVTIDASDWYIDSRLRKRLRQNPEANLDGFRDFYLQHLFDRASYYEKLAYELTGRHIAHTLLLHHNLSSALFLEDLIEHFQSKGWRVISAKDAFTDPIFQEVTKHAGESLIWAMAKDTGKYEKQLRYPAEDSRYEKDKMDKLGL